MSTTTKDDNRHGLSVFFLSNFRSDRISADGLAFDLKILNSLRRPLFHCEINVSE